MTCAYEERFYRRWVTADDLVEFDVCVDETDLAIFAEKELSAVARQAVERVRAELKEYIGGHGEFQTSMTPVEIEEDAPEIILEMARAAEIYGVGPMASVAGAVAEAAGRTLLESSRQVIVENGGDIFIKTASPRRVTLYAGPGSPFSKTLGIMADSTDAPLGICTSSGSVGHSLSYGNADAVVAVAASTAVADAAATAVANTISKPEDIQKALDREKSRGVLKGLLIALGRKLGAWGDIELA